VAAAGDKCLEQCSAIAERDVGFMDCLDFSAHICEMKSCCPECGDEFSRSQHKKSSHYYYDPSSNPLHSVTRCFRSSGCAVPKCHAMANGTCSDEYDNFSLSCKTKLADEQMTGKFATIPDPGKPWHYRELRKFDDYMGSIQSESFQPGAVEECKATAKSFQDCAVAEDAYKTNMTQAPIVQCRYLHNVWARCLQAERCHSRCLTTADRSCLMYDLTVCGQRCCCDACTEHFQAYEMCVQDPEYGDCPQPTNTCTDKFCLSGAAMRPWLLSALLAIVTGVVAVL